MNEARLARVFDNMRQQQITQILVTDTASIYYLTGLWVEPHERMLALYLELDGRQALFGNEIFGLTACDTGMELCTHTDSQNPVEALAQTVRPGPIGVDKFWPSKFLIGLMQLRADITPVHGSLPVDLARMYKDEQEIAALRHASAVNDRVVQGAIAAVHDGATEQELASLVNRLYLQNGADKEGEQLVCFGANAADPHHSAGPDLLKEGDGIVFDLFTPIGRYWCDMTRTVFYRGADEEQKRVYELVRRANQAAEEAIRPGLPLCEIDAIARRVIEEGGYGPRFTHRLGHGIGLNCHEPPDVSAASTAVAAPGMVFSVEPGIYLPGRLGVRIEDLVLVTETGCEVLNKASKELQIVS